jgi:hypothetical protein
MSGWDEFTAILMATTYLAHLSGGSLLGGVTGWDFLLFTLAVSAFIATVGCLMYAFERGRPIFWFAALVCGYVWYLSVSALRI